MRKSGSCLLLIFLSTFILCGALHAQEWVRVFRIDDGDTIVLADGRRVRYIGINTPEIGHDGQDSEPFARKAKAFNRHLVEDRRVRLEFDCEKTDRYGRLLAYLFLEDGVFVNKTVVAAGYAYVLYRHPNDRYTDVLLQAQREAMRLRKGIWHDWKERTGPYTANIKSKRFHLESCPFGKQTASENRRRFERQWDAFREGYAPGKRCLGTPK